MTEAEIAAVAGRIEACVEDALRPLPYGDSDNIYINPDPRVVCLANGLRAISEVLRAHLQGQSTTPNDSPARGSP